MNRFSTFEDGISKEWLQTVGWTSQQVDRINIKYLIVESANDSENKNRVFQKLANNGIIGNNKVYYLTYNQIKRIYYDAKKRESNFIKN
jgi:hypothetical protein